MYKLFGNVPHYMHAAFKNGYPQPHIYKGRKDNTRARTHTDKKQPNVIANLILSFSPHFIGALHRKKTQSFPRREYRSYRERYFIS